MSGKIPTIAIVGRTNVGKSTLFNALAGKRLSIVEDEPGVTRDRSYTFVDRFDFPFTLIDTGGLVGEEDSPYEDLVRSQAELAVEEADLVIGLFDGVVGLHPHDSDVVNYLRRSDKPTLWVINKCEKKLTKEASSEFFALGIEDFLCVSATGGFGIGEIIRQARKLLGITPKPELDAPPVEERTEGGSLRVAILGRPNVGKSTFINNLLGENRLVTSPHAGTTRDSIDVKVSLDGHEYIIVDTAGLRRRTKVDDATVERYANLRSLKALSECDVAVLLLDASDGTPSDQDKKIATLIHERGRPFIIAMNKWDLVEKDHRTAKQFEEIVHRSFGFTAYAPVLFISAQSGKRCSAVLKKARTVYAVAREHVQTARLNKVLGDAFRKSPPAAIKGKSVKLYYATQTDVAPPAFVLFVNYPEKVSQSYLRYVKSFFRREFPFEGTDVRLVLRKRESSKEAGKPESGNRNKR